MPGGPEALTKEATLLAPSACKAPSSTYSAPARELIKPPRVKGCGRWSAAGRPRAFPTLRRGVALTIQDRLAQQACARAVSPGAQMAQQIETVADNAAAWKGLITKVGPIAAAVALTYFAVAPVTAYSFGTNTPIWLPLASFTRQAWNWAMSPRRSKSPRKKFAGLICPAGLSSRPGMSIRFTTRMVTGREARSTGSRCQA